VERGVNETFTKFGIGTEVEVGYASNGEKKEVRLSLAQAPTHFRSAKRFKSKALGAAFADLTYEVRGYYKLADDAPGVVVSKVQPGNPAAVAGLRPLEIVTHVDDKPIKDVKALSDAVRGKKEFSFSVRRLAATRIVRVKMQDGGKGE
jgi:S1-C subfamily serine protease